MLIISALFAYFQHESEEWSSQLIFQFKQLERRSLKKSELQRDSNPWPLWYQCDALPTELWSHTLGARSISWVHIFREEWNDVKFIWNNSYMKLNEMKNDHRSKFCNLSNWKEEAWKNQGFNGIRTRDLRDTGAMLYQLSYEATHWERGQLVEFISSHEEWNDVKFIWNNSYMNCSCRWKWRMIIAVNFPIQAIGKKKPEKNQGFNGIRTHDLRDTGAMLYQLSYEWNDVKFIWNNSYMNCGCRWKWRMIIAVNFPI